MVRQSAHLRGQRARVDRCEAPHGRRFLDARQRFRAECPFCFTHRRRRSSCISFIEHGDIPPRTGRPGLGRIRGPGRQPDFRAPQIAETLHDIGVRVHAGANLLPRQRGAPVAGRSGPEERRRGRLPFMESRALFLRAQALETGVVDGPRQPRGVPLETGEADCGRASSVRTRCSDEEFLQARVSMTMVGGEIVYEAAGD